MSPTDSVHCITCTCNVLDVDAARAAAPPVEPRSDPEDGPNPWEPPSPVREAGLREALKHSSRDDLIHRIELLTADLEAERAALLAEPVPLDVERLAHALAETLDPEQEAWIAQIIRAYLPAARLTDPKGATDGD